MPPVPQADRDEARSQHAAALSQLEVQSQQLAEASAAKSHAEAAAEELQAEHDALTAQHTAQQTQVCQSYELAGTRYLWCGDQQFSISAGASHLV